MVVSPQTRPTQLLVSPPTVPSNRFDPFDTSHVGQLLKQTSTPQHNITSPNYQSGFGVMPGGMNVSQQPSAICADSNNSDSLFSGSVFGNSSMMMNQGNSLTADNTPGKSSNFSTRNADSPMNIAWNESKMFTSGGSAVLDSPLQPSKVQNETSMTMSTPMAAPFVFEQQQKVAPSPATVDEALNVLCDINNLNLMPQQGKHPMGLSSRQDPFLAVKNPPKPTISELLKTQTGGASDANTNLAAPQVQRSNPIANYPTVNFSPTAYPLETAHKNPFSSGMAPFGSPVAPPLAANPMPAGALSTSAPAIGADSWYLPSAGPPMQPVAPSSNLGWQQTPLQQRNATLMPSFTDSNLNFAQQSNQPYPQDVQGLLKIQGPPPVVRGNRPTTAISSAPSQPNGLLQNSIYGAAQPQIPVGGHQTLASNPFSDDFFK